MHIKQNSLELQEQRTSQPGAPRHSAQSCGRAESYPPQPDAHQRHGSVSPRLTASARRCQQRREVSMAEPNRKGCLTSLRVVNGIGPPPEGTVPVQSIQCSGEAVSAERLAASENVA